jgi:hypothetical protein
MDPTALITVAGMTGAAIAGGGVSRLFRVRSQNSSDDANSASILAKAYSLLVDDLQKASHRQDAELTELRAELARSWRTSAPRAARCVRASLTWSARSSNCHTRRSTHE